MTAAGRRVGSPAVDLPLPAVTISDAAAAVRAEVRGDDGRLLTDASFDSRAVAPESLFFCIAGDHADGHRFAPAALAAGAGAFVVERWLDLGAPQALVPSVRGAIGPMSSVIFGRPAEALLEPVDELGFDHEGFPRPIAVWTALTSNSGSNGFVT